MKKLMKNLTKHLKKYCCLHLQKKISPEWGDRNKQFFYFGLILRLPQKVVWPPRSTLQLTGTSKVFILSTVITATQKWSFWTGSCLVKNLYEIKIYQSDSFKHLFSFSQLQIDSTNFLTVSALTLLVTQ